jgi:hypothetical protein
VTKNKIASITYAPYKSIIFNPESLNVLKDKNNIAQLYHKE